MTEKPGLHGLGLVIVSFVIALLLTVLPLPHWAVFLRPEWVCLVLVYWVIMRPDSVGLLTAWSVGIMRDVMGATLLGQHALALCLVAYVARKLHHRLRMFPLLQQALCLSLLVGIHQLTLLWVRGLTGHVEHSAWYWAPLLTSALLWPWVFYVLRYCARDSIGIQERNA